QEYTKWVLATTIIKQWGANSRHASESWHPESKSQTWMPASAGMTDSKMRASASVISASTIEMHPNIPKLEESFKKLIAKLKTIEDGILKTYELNQFSAYARLREFNNLKSLQHALYAFEQYCKGFDGLLENRPLVIAPTTQKLSKEAYKTL